MAGPPAYRPLAIAPDGFKDPYGITRAPMTLEPTNPGSLILVRELLAELLPLFTSRRVHVGLDEAWELPHTRIDDFLAWVVTLRALPELEGHHMLMWGDMISGQAELVGSHPTRCDRVRVGLRRLVPLRRALRRAGRRRRRLLGGARHLELAQLAGPGDATLAAPAATPPKPRWPTAPAATSTPTGATTGTSNSRSSVHPDLAYGAAVSWCLDANADLDLGAALSAHVFGDATGCLAEALLALGDPHLMITPQFPNMSALVMNLYYPQLPVGRSLTAGLTTAEVEAVGARLTEIRSLIDQARPTAGDATAVVEEMVFSTDLVSLLLRDASARLAVDGHIGSVPEHERVSLTAELDELIARYRALWSARSRPGGLDDSVAWLLNVRAAYVTGQPDPSWGGLSVT